MRRRRIGRLRKRWRGGRRRRAPSGRRRRRRGRLGSIGGRRGRRVNIAEASGRRRRRLAALRLLAREVAASPVRGLGNVRAGQLDAITDPWIRQEVVASAVNPPERRPRRGWRGRQRKLVDKGRRRRGRRRQRGKPPWGRGRRFDVVDKGRRRRRRRRQRRRRARRGLGQPPPAREVRRLNRAVRRRGGGVRREQSGLSLGRLGGLEAREAKRGGVRRRHLVHGCLAFDGACGAAAQLRTPRRGPVGRARRGAFCHR